MKKNLLNSILLIIAGCTLVGCVGISVATREVAAPSSVKQGDIIEIAITIAREVGFPPATKIDKENGIVEFGHYEASEVGITAQVRVKSPTEIEVVIKRLTPYVTLAADKQADEFTAKLKEQLGDAAVKVIK